MRKNRDYEELNHDEEIIMVSKSELKRDAHELKELGAKLAELKPDLLAKIPLQGRIIDAITEVSRIKSHNARKRQFGFIGKLMQDQDIDAIRHQLAMLDTSSEEYSRHFHILERWRERLLNDGNSALTTFLDEYPHADAQQLRQLVRNTLKEKSEEKKATLGKKLFRYLRELSED